MLVPLSLRCVLFAVCLCVSGRQAPTSPTSAPVTAQEVIARWRAGQPVRTIVLGDSIGLGCCADGWERLQTGADRRLTPQSEADNSVRSVTVQLRLLIQSRNTASVVRNASADGGRALKLVPEIPGLLAAGYDLAFVPLQINDINNGIPMGEFENHHTQLIRAIQAAGVIPVLVKENPIWDLPQRRFGNPSFAEFMSAVDRIAVTFGLSVVDTYTPFQSAVTARGGIATSGLYSDEGMHPNQAGHDLLFQGYATWFRSGTKGSADDGGGDGGHTAR